MVNAVAAQCGRFFLPACPAHVFVEQRQIAAKCPVEEIGVAQFAVFPFEGVGREVEHIAGGAVQSAAVEGEVAACGVIGNQVIGRGGGRFGLGAAEIPAAEAARQAGAARAQDAQPAVIDQDAAGFIHHRAHHGAGAYLGFHQFGFCSGRIARQDFHRIGGFGKPLLNQRPCGVGSIDEVG